jgi:hypothetical protein
LNPVFSGFVGSEDIGDDNGDILFDDRREEFRGGLLVGKGKDTKRFFFCCGLPQVPFDMYM